MAIVLGVAALTTAAGLFIAPPARATATIALKTPPSASVLASGLQGDASLARYTAQRARFVRSDKVIEAVAKDLRRDDITEIRGQVSATPAATSNAITIVAFSPDEAEKAWRPVALGIAVPALAYLAGWLWARWKAR